MDITEVILHQHGEQRRMFAMLEEWPREDSAGLDALWQRLEILLEVHAEAEERYFYPQLVKLGKGGGDAPSVDEEVEDAIKDHNEIRDAVRAVRGSATGSAQLWKSVLDANVANSDHMAEEERQDLTDFREHASLDLRHSLAIQFARFEAEHWATGVPLRDKDPEQFVEDNEPPGKQH